MSFLRHLLRRYLLPILLPVSLISLVYIYLYPLFHGNACTFPLPTYTSEPSPFSPFLHTLADHLPITTTNNNTDAKAPFRLLILADPQLEGDTSLPSPADSLSQKLATYYTDIFHTGPGKYTSRGVREHTYTSLLRNTLRTLVTRDLPVALRAARKRLDLWGNDYYLAHVYRTLRWWARGTHTVVLGDLVGSQWVDGGEFEERGRRYWGRVFAGGEKVDVEEDGWEEELGDRDWERRVINVAGNHDIGYAGDISWKRMERFERVFGKGDWDVRFKYPEGQQEDGSVVPTLHMVVLNSLILDTPAFNQSLQDETYRFLNGVIDKRSSPLNASEESFTLLLTHVPLHKQAGICTDAPYFGYFDEDDTEPEIGEDGETEPRFQAGGLREQNHLSDHISQKGILEGIFGMGADEKGRNGVILTGHDHTGCDVVHYVDRQTQTPQEEEEVGQGEGDGESWSWNARRYTTSPPPSSPTSETETDSPSIREVTLRSMMGEYGGNAGFLSVWFDTHPENRGWKYEISTCMFGVQHIWWGVHGVAVVTGVLVFVWGVLEVWEGRGKGRRRERERREMGVKKRQ
ncbi:hypothetical protein FQN54_004968 [Arachnomyces sp. PD_36]|nr:hypothetical protein FQN54_004968 [Arachnomyces sp. PD_36]